MSRPRLPAPVPTVPTAPPPIPLQRKLTVGSSTDPLEQEADRVADQVVSGSRAMLSGSAPLTIQRRSAAAGDFAGEVPDSVTSTLSGTGTPLEPGLRDDMGARFGRDFSGVRVHQGGLAAQSARAVGARAYTVGNNIVFGAGAFAPHSQDGRRLIAHELTHTLQQADGAGNGTALLQRALGPVLDRVEELMSYSAGDWAIRDHEAMEALALLGTIPPANLVAELAKLDSKYTTRLLDNLPDAAKTGDLFQRVVEALGASGVLPYATEQLDTGLFDWAITDAEVTNVFNSFVNLGGPAQEKFLTDLNAAGRLGPLIDNCNSGHHALYVRPWIASLTRGALTAGQRALLKTIVANSGDDALETLKLATATRFDVTVEKRAMAGKVIVEWEPAQLRETYLVLDDLPEAHVGKNKFLEHLVQFNQPAKDNMIVAGFYRESAKTLAVNSVPSSDFADTIRHETGHAADKQLGWTTGPEPATPARGGWKDYGSDYATCATDMVDDAAGGIKALVAAQRTAVEGEMATAMSNRSAAGLKDRIRNLAWFAGLKDAEKTAILDDKALEAVRVGLTQPWMTDDGGGVHLGTFIYHEGYPNQWVRYLHAARSRKVSNYQFRDPGEWFGEVYAWYYAPDPRGKGAKLNDKDPSTKTYFDNVVDKMAASR